MPRYSLERREAVLKKLLPPHSRSVPDVAAEENISEQTLYNWLKQLRSEGKPVPHSGQKKLAQPTVTTNRRRRNCKEDKGICSADLLFHG
ncbi:hypothetical protein UN63_05125 [Oceanisphaera arctica]|uniref:Transposase n=1 Tax=Oceanisphaera arctica TaxID=641510 RepID=A0A2P5TP42_9GAMM|nr:hypothetical protein UN63_05125 [Oceanisphaera arctica]GHA08185.1 hypothetical protein GCM10007082_06370 [Oceanisphaera arctica]